MKPGKDYRGLAPDSNSAIGEKIMQKSQPGHIVPIEARPCLDFASFALYIGLPESTLEAITREFPAPMFNMGRCRFILTRDVLPWLEGVAAENPHYRRIRQGRFTSHTDKVAARHAEAA